MSRPDPNVFMSELREGINWDEYFGIAVTKLNISPKEFYDLSFREFYSCLYVMFPPDKEDLPVKTHDHSFFSEEDYIKFQDMNAIQVRH